MICAMALALLLAQVPAPLVVAPERSPDPTGPSATPLPERVTVCIAATPPRCRLAAAEGMCGAPAREFRTVLAADTERALADCAAASAAAAP